jgi:hypothetical protein
VAAARDLISVDNSENTAAPALERDLISVENA